ncbi:MAG: PfkB family carbohydrate kinase [bacterium]|nr:PfkB family carbohydrate kinase [bacterium]
MIATEKLFFDQLDTCMAAKPAFLLVGPAVKDLHYLLPKDGPVQLAGDFAVFPIPIDEKGITEMVPVKLGSKVPINGDPLTTGIVEEIMSGKIPSIEHKETRGGNVLNVSEGLSRLRQGGSREVPPIGTIELYADVGKETAEDIRHDGIEVIPETDEEVRPMATGVIVTMQTESGNTDRIIFSSKPMVVHTFTLERIPRDSQHAPALAFKSGNGPDFVQEVNAFMASMYVSEIPVAYMPSSSELRVLSDWLANPEDRELTEKRDTVYDLFQFAEIVFANKQEIQGLVAGWGMTPSEDAVELIRQAEHIRPSDDERVRLQKENIENAGKYFEYEEAGITPFDAPSYHKVARGPRVVVMTDAGNPVLVKERDGAVYKATPYPTHIVSFEGAGDAFASGFTGAYESDRAVTECIQWGLANAASVIEHVGTTTGLLDHTGIEERIGRYPDHKVDVLDENQPL